MNRILTIMALVTLCLSAAQAGASELITSRTVLEDKSGTLTIADVAHREGVPFGPTLSVSGTDHVVWVRLQIHAPAQGSKVVLYILPTYINEIRMYEAGPGDPNHWTTRLTGNIYPFAERDRSSTALGFVVTPTTSEATYYLRIKNSPFQCSVEAMTLDQAIQKDHRRDLLVLFFLTSMLGLLLWAVHAYYLDRELVVGLFAIHQAAYTLFGFVLTGYLAPLSSAHFPLLANWMGNVLYLLINFTIVLFCRELFKPYDPPPLAKRLSKLLLWASLPLFVLVLAGFDDIATTANALLIRVSWVYLAVTVFLLRAESTPPRRLLQAFFVSAWINNIFFWYLDRGSLPISRTDLGMLQILVVDGFLMGGIFALMLHSRIRQKLRDGHQSALDLEWVRKNFEIQQELKRQIEIQAQTDCLTKLSNRRHFIELAERELARAIRFQRPMTLLAIDVDHFKQINDTCGHRTGDAVLQEVADVLRRVLRAEDILGRIGGDEFAVVLVELEGLDSLGAAQRLCAAVAATIITPLPGAPIRGSISIGLAQLQQRSIDFNSLLDEADHALYGAKNAGRNQVFVASHIDASQPESPTPHSSD